MACGEMTGIGKSSENPSLVLEARKQAQAQDSVAVVEMAKALVGL